MDLPIHAANEMDKGETLPKVIAAVAGVVMLVIAGIALVYSGFWAPPPTSVATTQTTAPSQ